MKPKSARNRLGKETSPYLLQHASNPVDWYPWSPEALTRAKMEDKPIILSIGYSSCHWCHVMERESFENDTIAQVMNSHYVCIKVDREERPDVDQVYMDSLHAMGVQGGWPLNVFLTPDQEPFYGGTYFPPDQWHSLLQKIHTAFQDHRSELENSARKFTEAISREDSPFDPSGLERPTLAHLKTIFEKLVSDFDLDLGGTRGAPKFPMPVIWEFCLQYYRCTKDQRARDQLDRTLTRMAMGGIYDQVGGGFSRYSVDKFWFAPHFEKMLYDNGQLVSLFSLAFRDSPNLFYKLIVKETTAFVQRELTSPEGGFYSAIDADSEGKEGRFYVWTHAELEEILGEDINLLSKRYGIEPGGNWEDGQNILHLTQTPGEFVKDLEADQGEGLQRLFESKQKLLAARSKRVRPGLDDKILSGWNGIMLKGLVDAYIAFGEQQHLEMATRNARFLKERMILPDGLRRTFKDGQAKITGFLEDLAWVALGFLSLYQITLEEQWLEEAKQLVDHAMDRHFDERDGYFFLNGSQTDQLIARKKELFDNVIPGSNSVMAQSLMLLGSILEEPIYLDTAKNMLIKTLPLLQKHPGSLAKWSTLLTQVVSLNYEIAVVGPEAPTFIRELMGKIMSPAVFMGTTSRSSLPLLRGKESKDQETWIYVCRNRTCKLPVRTVEEALSQID